MATPLDVVYASGGEARIVTFELQCAAWAEPLRLLANEYEDLVMGLEDGSAALFEAGGIDYSLPKVGSSGQQAITAAIDNVRGTAQQLIDQALEAGERVVMKLRTYVASDLTTPAERPLRLSVMSAGMRMATVQIEAGFYDMLGRRYPIHFYTADKFPGVKYLV